MRAVFDDEQVVLARDRHKRVHIARVSGVVDEHQCARLGRDLAPHVGRVEGQGVGAHIAKDRHAVVVQNRVIGRDKRQRRRDHLAALEAEDLKGEIQCRRARVHAADVGCADELTKSFFKFGGFGAKPDPARFNALSDGRPLFVTDGWLEYRNHRCVLSF